MSYKRNPFRQQGPGGNKIFSNKPSLDIEKNKIASNKQLGTLAYLIEKKDGWVSKKEIETDLPKYWYKFYGLKVNESKPSHPIRTFMYWGIISTKPNKDLFRITESGKVLYDILAGSESNKDYNLSKLMLNLAYDVKYPNAGTPKVHQLVRTYPLRMAFYYLRRYDRISSDFWIRKFPYIISIDDFHEDIDYCFSGDPIQQFFSYVIMSFVDLGILNYDKSNKLVSISEEYRALIDSIFCHDEVEDLFHSEYFNQIEKNSIRNYRDNYLALLVKKRDNFTCRLTGLQVEEYSRNYHMPLCYVHHIIPMHQQVNFMVNLNCEENMITILGHVHSVIHEAEDRDRKHFLIKAYNCLPEEFIKRSGITLERYFRIYDYSESAQTLLF